MAYTFYDMSDLLIMCMWLHVSFPFRKFIAEKLPPLQFKNPNVQVVLFKNRHQFPAVWVYFSDGNKIMLAVEGKTPDKIMDELTAVAAKTE